MKSHLQQNLANKLLSFSFTLRFVLAAKMLCYEGEFFLCGRAHGGPQQPKHRKHTNPIFSAMRDDLSTIICMSGRLGGGIVGIIKKIQNTLI